MFIGKEGFNWWIGIVEDNEDPLNLCRAKVRIFGYHPDFASNKVPTNDLPWALTVMSMNVPDSHHRPPLGEWVCGFFLDEAEQEPAILGYIPGLASIASFSSKGTAFRSFSKITERTKNDFVINKANTVLSVSNSGHFSVDSSNSVFLETANGIINIKRGSSQIQMSANGDIRITGNNVIVSSEKNLILNATQSVSILSSNVNIGVAATQNVTIRGSRIDLN